MNKETVKSLYESGMTLQAIGDKYGVTRQRIHQLLRYSTKARVTAGINSTPQELLNTRFWRNVRKTSNCWLWLKNGIPCIWYGTKMYKGKVYKAHRLAWELTNGAIPKGLWVLHKCDNPPCVRPDHLFLGTHKDNVKDAMSKGRTKRKKSPGTTP